MMAVCMCVGVAVCVGVGVAICRLLISLLKQVCAPLPELLEWVLHRFPAFLSQLHLVIGQETVPQCSLHLWTIHIRPDHHKKLERAEAQNKKSTIKHFVMMRI